MSEKIFQPNISREKISKRKEEIILEIKKKKEERKKENEEKGMTRRSFLRLSGMALLGGATSGAVKKMELAHKALAPLEKIAEKEEEEDFNDEIYFEGEIPDIKAIRGILDFNSKKRIEINLQTAKDLENYWEYQYATAGKEDFVKILERMKPYFQTLRDIFAEHGVPEKYSLLAIPESGWDFDEISKAGAEGPYQFMPETGAEYGLMNSADLRNPYKSADACARFLKKLYNQTHDWDLALSGYNGGFMGRYLKKCKNENLSPSYKNFLGFLTEKANQIKEEVRQNLFTKHVVSKKETLHSISEKYSQSMDVIRKHNKIKNDHLRLGQTIKIPISNKRKEEMFQSKIRFIAQNLNYPPKFNAVYKLVETTLAWNKGANKESRA